MNIQRSFSKTLGGLRSFCFVLFFVFVFKINKDEPKKKEKEGGRVELEEEEDEREDEEMSDREEEEEEEGEQRTRCSKNLGNSFFCVCFKVITENRFFLFFLKINKNSVWFAIIIDSILDPKKMEE